MDRKSVAQLERLLSELADEGATRERVAKIESLLLDNPELQDHYWSWMDIHVVLGTDRSAILGESTTTNSPVSRVSQPPRPKFIQNANSPSRQNFRWWLAPALAAAACLVFVFVSDGFTWRQLSPQLGTAEKAETWQIPRITRVTWEGPYFADPEKSDSLPVANEGLVSLGFVDGLPVNGYVLRLDPGTTAELVMAADAYAENNLSVIELSASGKPVRRSVSFNNFGPGEIPIGDQVFSRTRRYGLIGTWSEFNETDQPKYFLLNGIHKSENPDLSELRSEQEFQLSRMVVALEEPDLVVIGWDDGGIEPSQSSPGVEIDGDYDDITVAIRISRQGVDPILPSDVVRIVAESVPNLETPQTDGSDRHRFTLVPGEIAILNMSSDALKLNLIYLLDEESGEVLWNAENTNPGATNLGAIALQNTGDDDMKLALFGENSSRSRGENAEWESSKMKTFHSQHGCTILGFEDQDKDEDVGDFDDIRVTLLSLLPGRNTPFEHPARSQE